MPVTQSTPLNLDRDPVDVAIGARLRARRTARRLSLESLGHSLGVTYQQVQKYETGANRLSCATLLRLCDALKCTPDDILYGTAIAPRAGGPTREEADLLNRLGALPTGTARTVAYAALRGMLDQVETA